MFIDRRSKGSYYDVLMVEPSSSDSEIKDAFMKLCDIYHPDRTSNKKIAALRFRLINEAYAALRCEEGRSRYNRLLLMKSGKPKGLNLVADNDNYNPQEKRIREMLSGLLKPRAKAEDYKSENTAQQNDLVMTQELDDMKDRDHG